MTSSLTSPITIFLTIMAVVLITPILSERVRLPGIVGIILGGMLVGPHVFNLLSTSGELEFLATIGLIYLMFSAGLEVDIHQFSRVGGRSLVFGLLTFFFPLLMGMGLGRLLGMNWLGAVLLGSAFSSHTLIAFPILTRLGVVRNEAVAVTVGATVLTDIGAFLVLAVVLGVQKGNLTAGYFIKLFGFLALFAVLIRYGLPPLGKWFFRRFSSRAIGFQFVLVVLFVAALAAVKIGVHEVVGAFLAGLAINATLPHKSPVTGHVLFIGESFFIPIFLMYSGMMTDPAAFVQNWQTIVVAVGVTLVAYLSKLAASWVTARIFHYSRDEFFTAFGLSHAQAAVTIPTLVIGLQVGLFSNTLFNAAILMILLTSITSPLLVQRFAHRLHADEPERPLSPIFSRILVPIANPQTQEHLLTLASILARSSAGKLIALHVARKDDSHVIGLDEQQVLLEKVPEIIKDPETDVQLLGRVDRSAAQGILNAAIETQTSVIFMGWRGKPTLRESLLGSILDEVVWGTNVPVMVGKLGVSIDSLRRVVLVLSSECISPAAVRHTLETMVTVSQALNVPLWIAPDGSYLEKVEELVKKMEGQLDCIVKEIKGSLVRSVEDLTNPSDLVVLPSGGSRKRFQSSLGDLPERLARAEVANVIVLHESN